MPRPRSPLLSVEAIVSTALDLIDESGNFSFPRIAKRLEVSQSSLYNHIQNREHIIELIRAQVFAEQLQVPVEDLPWDEALRAVIRAYRASGPPSRTPPPTKTGIPGSIPPSRTTLPPASPAPWTWRCRTTTSPRSSVPSPAAMAGSRCG